MENRDLQGFVKKLEKEGELIRVRHYVNPELEMTEIADRFSKSAGGGKAILFENNGTGFPVLMNFLGSEKRMAMAFGRNSVFDIEKEIHDLFAGLMQPKNSLWEKLKMLPLLKEVSQWLPKKMPNRGKCQEVVMNSTDLNLLPVLKCWPADGGPFITFPCVHTIDPETGIPNVGMYRMQVFDKDLTGMHWHRHKTGANHFEKYKKAGKRMPVSVSLGGDPVYTYAATAPMPENMDEYLLAGFLRKKTVKLVKCLTNDLYVPEDADFVIEGYVDPAEEMIWEGPFGDHTGFYSLADWYPKFHVTCITHRKDAVYPSTIVGIPPMEDAYIGLATERIFLTPIRMSMIPELIDMSLPVAGVAHNFAVVKIKKSFPGQAIKVMNSLWGAGQMMFNKILVVADEHVDIQNHEALIKAFIENFNTDYSLHFSKGPLDVLDHASDRFAFGSKLGIDLTKPLPEEKIKAKTPASENQDFETKSLAEISEITGFKNLADEYNLPILLVAVKKDTMFDKIEFFNKLKSLKAVKNFKAVLLFNEGAVLNDLFMIFWLLGGNLEPLRDVVFITGVSEEKTVFVDATFKTGEHDQFQRDWPNVVTMNSETISTIDDKWEQLGFGEFVSSPSLKYLPLVKGDGAVRGN